MSWRYRTRVALAIFAVFILVLLIVTAVPKYISVRRDPNVADKPYNELIKSAVDTRIDQSKALFQVGLLMTAALWGLLIAKEQEAKLVLSDRPELWMFVCASLLLLVSFVCHISYLEVVAYFYHLGGEQYVPNNASLPDMFDPKVDFLYEHQIWFLVAGFTTAAVTLISAHQLKD